MHTDLMQGTEQSERYNISWKSRVYCSVRHLGVKKRWWHFHDEFSIVQSYVCGRPYSTFSAEWLRSESKVNLFARRSIFVGCVYFECAVPNPVIWIQLFLNEILFWHVSVGLRV
jgi:hypothetical protein